MNVGTASSRVNSFTILHNLLADFLSRNATEDKPTAQDCKVYFLNVRKLAYETTLLCLCMYVRVSASPLTVFETTKYYKNWYGRCVIRCHK
jgi:hypothetical protein